MKNCRSFQIAIGLALGLGLMGIALAAPSSYDKTGYLGLFKQSPYYDLQMGSRYAHNHQEDKAQKHFKRVTEVYPASVLGQYNYAYSELLLSQKAKTPEEKQQHLFNSEWAFQRARDLNPELALSYFKLGKMALDRADYQAACNYYKQGVENNPDNAALWFNLGAAYEKVSDLEHAEKAYVSAIQQNPRFVYAHNNLGLLYEQTHRADMAEAVYKAALDEVPGYNFARLNLGSLLQSQGRLEEAKSYYQEALKYEPDNSWAYLYLGNISYRSGDYQAALDSYNKAISLNPDYPTTYYLASLALEKLNRTDEALASGMYYIHLAPDGAFSQEAGELIMTLRQAKDKTSSAQP